MKSKRLLILAAFSGALAVGLGAMGSHLLDPVLTELNRKETYQTAVNYHFYHTLALLGIGIMVNRFNSSIIYLSGLIMFLGIILFSGSLYNLSVTGNTIFAYITPFGGILLLISWLVLAYGLFRIR